MIIKKRSAAKELIFFLEIILILNLLLASICAQEQKKFDPKKGESWQYGSAVDFNSVSAEDIANNPNHRDDYWEKFRVEEKNKFAALELKKNAGKEIKTNNLGDSHLKLKGNILSDGKVSFNLKNSPDGLKSINYQVVKKNDVNGDNVDEKGYRFKEITGFIYDFGESNKVIVTEEGYLDKGKKIQGTKNSFMNGIKIPDKGTFQIDSKGIVFSDEIKIGEITYRPYKEGSYGRVNPISETRAEIQNAEAVSSRGIIGASSILTLAVFDDNTINEIKYKQYARLGKDNLEIVGNDIDVEILQAYKNVKFSGKSLSLKNGEVIYKINKDGNFKIPGAQETIANDMFRIENLMDPNGNVFINTHLGEGSLLRDIRGYVRVGTVNLGIGDEEGDSEISKEAGFKAFGGIKAELVVPEGSKIPPEKGDPKTLVMGFTVSRFSEDIAKKLEEGSKEKMQDSLKGAAVSGAVGIMGKAMGFDVSPAANFRKSLLNGLGYEDTSGVMGTAFGAFGMYLDSKTYNQVLSAIRETKSFKVGDQIKFSVTSDGKGMVMLPGGRNIEVNKNIADGVIMGMTDKYPRLLGKH